MSRIPNRQSDFAVPRIFCLTDFFLVRRFPEITAMPWRRLLTDVLLTPVELPRCTRCGARMMLAQIEQREKGSEERTFECPKCDFIETRIAVDPLTSDAVIRLVSNIKPPS